MKNLVMDGVVESLNNILGDRFGVSVQYISISDTKRNRAGTLETVKRNAGAPMIVGDNQLIVPLRVEGALVGATRVGDINSLTPKELSEVKATIDLVVGAAMHSNILPFARRAHA